MAIVKQYREVKVACLAGSQKVSIRITQSTIGTDHF